ncbi:MAG: adenylate/guanylate cyclase domain-containing protein [Alphaproteobacteria bacterium]|nr:adenylate/guanylate cyclase domain-containing protein [Alphaproteobacteria bacterium]
MSDASAICAWLLEPATGRMPLAPFADGLAARVAAAGVPLDRLSLSLRTRHPEVFVLSAMWDRGSPAVQVTRPRSLLDSPTYLDSPVYAVSRDGRAIRQDLRVPADAIRWPVCVDLKAEGYADYYIQPMPAAWGDTSFASWTTRDPDGFQPAHIAVLDAVAPTLALRMEAASAHLATDHLLRVYLGDNAAQRVLDGAFVRGSGERMEVAIWFCDLRGFTRFTDTAPLDCVVPVLDDWFERVAGPIVANGGEVLKFIGDAMLAVFPSDRGADAACVAALTAARQALATREALEAGLDFGVGLHYGEVVYGNIGAAERLDFTVIGRAVNEASRVEGMCKPLGQSLLVTRAFAAHCPDGLLRSLGEHTLRGVAAPQELLTLAE